MKPQGWRLGLFKPRLIVALLRQVRDYWTDAQVHSVDRNGYGLGNCGMRGIRRLIQHFLRWATLHRKWRMRESCQHGGFTSFSNPFAGLRKRTFATTFATSYDYLVWMRNSAWVEA